VGLKHDLAQLMSTNQERRPQSNQRGIETGLAHPAGPGPGGGLNRTSVGLKRQNAPQTLVDLIGLNRTSVGLKRALTDPAATREIKPQSNQRGIETAAPGPIGSIRESPQSNQRGIETETQTNNKAQISVPQSNQRGIETEAVNEIYVADHKASIEPAWD